MNLYDGEEGERGGEGEESEAPGRYRSWGRDMSLIPRASRGAVSVLFLRPLWPCAASINIGRLQKLSIGTVLQQQQLWTRRAVARGESCIWIVGWYLHCAPQSCSHAVIPIPDMGVDGGSSGTRHG